jgi:hypothetical protein
MSAMRPLARPVPAAAVLTASVLLLAGCSSVVPGQGAASVSAASSSSRPDFPSSSAPAPNSSSSRSSSGPPSGAQRADVLRALAAGDSVSGLVPVAGGFEAASWDDTGGIRFWFDPAGSVAWRRVGTSRYPYSAALGAPHVAVQGARLRGMDHATFIATGVFTTDGSGNAVAYTTGPRGWGAIKAERNGNIGPSGAPVGGDRIGLSFGFAFSGGYLITADCPANRPIAQCGAHQVRKRWRWAGSDFRRV